MTTTFRPSAAQTEALRRLENRHPAVVIAYGRERTTFKSLERRGLAYRDERGWFALTRDGQKFVGVA